MRKQLIRFIAEVSIFTALGLVLDFVAGLISATIWKNGGYHKAEDNCYEKLVNKY